MIVADFRLIYNVSILIYNKCGHGESHAHIAFYRQRFGYQTANNDLKPNKFYCSYTTNLKL